MRANEDRKCVLVISHALILGWITNIHEILSAESADENDSDVTKENCLDFIQIQQKLKNQHNLEKSDFKKLKKIFMRCEKSVP